MNKGLSPSRQMWNRVMTALVWASAVLVMVLVAGIIGMVLVRGIPHISWKFLSTTASVLKKTDGILPAILNTLYVIVLTLLIVLPLGVGAAVYLTEYAPTGGSSRSSSSPTKRWRASPASSTVWWVCWCSVRRWASRPVCCPVHLRWWS